MNMRYRRVHKQHIRDRKTLKQNKKKHKINKTDTKRLLQEVSKFINVTFMAEFAFLHKQFGFLSYNRMKNKLKSSILSLS